MIVLLDTGVLGKLCSPDPERDVDVWFTGVLQRGRQVFIPEICDYELRRELVRANLKPSITALDDLAGLVSYLPLSTDAMREAARLWARVRNDNTPTASDESLDGDCILAGQALTCADSPDQVVVVATTNVKHLALMVDARRWADIS